MSFSCLIAKRTKLDIECKKPKQPKKLKEQLKLKAIARSCFTREDIDQIFREECN